VLSEKKDVQVEGWVANMQGIYVKIMNKAWLEWGEEILPHFTKNSKDVATVKMEESLEEEYKTRINALGDKYVEAQIMKEEYRWRTLNEVVDEGKSKAWSSVSVKTEKDEDLGHGDKGAGLKSVESINVDGTEEVDKVEKLGEVVDVDGEEARVAEVTSGTTGTHETTAAKQDTMVVTSRVNTIQGAKGSKEVEATADDARVA
jgi:hypothetical protein